jgi:long-subunit fatty acid transport protein
MKIKNILGLTVNLFLLSLLNYCFAQDVSYRGTSAANFLKINLSAKSVGMAESDITYAEDASCLFYNPGGISRIDGPSVSFSYVEWLVQTSLGYCAVTLPVGFGTAGLDVSYFSSGNIEETTLEMQDGTGRFVTVNDVAIGLSLARNLTDRFSVGLKVKYIHENLADVSASAVAVDIGSIFETSFLNNLKLGIALSNFGSSMEFTGDDLLVTNVVPNSPTNKEISAVLQTNEWSIPLFFKIGCSTAVISTEGFKMLVAYCLTDSRDYGARHNVGSEIELMDVIRIRGGYRFNYDETTFSIGAGVKVFASSMGTMFFDYAFTNFGVLDGVNQFSLSVNF